MSHMALYCGSRATYLQTSYYCEYYYFCLVMMSLKRLLIVPNSRMRSFFLAETNMLNKKTRVGISFSLHSILCAVDIHTDLLTYRIQ